LDSEIPNKKRVGNTFVKKTWWLWLTTKSFNVGISTDRSHASGKLMVTVLMDMEGILLIEYIKKGLTITGDVL
jgi:hypothetical protein